MTPVDVYVRAVEAVWLAGQSLTVAAITAEAETIAAVEGVDIPKQSTMVYRYREDGRVVFGSVDELIEVAQLRSVGDLRAVVCSLPDDPVEALTSMWVAVAVRPAWLAMLLLGRGPADLVGERDENLVEMRAWLGEPSTVAAWLGVVAGDVHGFAEGVDRRAEVERVLSMGEAA